MRELLAEAIRLTVSMERNSELLYRKGATAEGVAHRNFFERLAQVQSRRIDALLRQLSQRDAADAHPVAPLARPVQTGENAAAPFSDLHQALLDKRSNIDLYATFCRCFKEPSLCRFFETALAVARREFKLITAEYLKGGGLSAAPAAWSPPRRSHQRGELPHRFPNRHSQLFFAMQDCGRQSRIG
ncbi:ferritin [Geomonas subterranea]|uniref:Ferritin n=1 Tax=Geomonas subterranea TaxID=2847989 RepID=A0ABX8LMJ5_9BACT|nr:MULTISPECIES: ferritin [Geomonas]QXE92719.1 ferritin [Geomonas subterranea]QXM09181.1 ferritin [Geomonas subterranea]